MTFSQLHEQLRLELLRRIERGVLSGTLLARQTGLKHAHISNFLHRRRRLSLDALDRVLSAQSITLEELLAQAPTRQSQAHKHSVALTSRVALVSQSVAIYESQIRTSSILELVQLPAGYLDHLRPRRSSDRKDWERFVAVRVSYVQAEPMGPVIAPHAILVIDRQYNSLVSHRPPMPSIYAIHRGNTMLLRYATLYGSTIVLRPQKMEHPIELIEMKPEESLGNIVVGRICASISEA
ncbi:helix-turn-helix domain-containing protein [Alloacidobacterium dinghuense]|uniref:Helix-turn-helix domain-containing protein n=1 Tax=Alloacidobacterium dinghuense TaxID=2763107 RepID=A0A7G8BGF4_9BACT|nr:helix-turn-helix transcriptional regulator [Alloacidobacterium dinghuense]QNI31624.1 helix-turn-helix domain-containing protein [Alloacidobacterium dinghuense]